MSTFDSGPTTSTESRALTLLGSGINPEAVASACGVTVSRISQLLSQEEFAAKVAALRFENLQRHNERDHKYDDVEDTLIERLRDCLPLMLRPMEILKAIQVINAAKRRGVSSPDSIPAQQTVIPLVLPTIIINKFSVSTTNQVIQAGEQNLVTMQSGTLMDRLKGIKGEIDGSKRASQSVIEERVRQLTMRETEAPAS